MNQIDERSWLSQMPGQTYLLFMVIALLFWLSETIALFIDITDGVLRFQTPHTGELLLHIVFGMFLSGVAVSVAYNNRRLATEQSGLIRERNLLRALIDHLPDPIYVKDLSSRYIVANTAAIDTLTNGQPLQVIGKTDFDFMAKDAAEQHFATETTIKETGISITDADEVLSPTSSETTLNTKVALRNKQGEVIGIAGLSRDLSELKKAQSALQDAYDQINTTLNALPVLLFEIDIEGLILSYHAIREDLLYTRPENFLNKTVAEVLPEEAAEVIMRAVREMVSTGQHGDATYYLDKAEGREWFEATIALKPRIDGAQQRLILLANNVTEKKLAELERERLLESEREQRLNAQHKQSLLELFVRHAPAAVAMFDLDLRYVAVSERWLQDYKLQDDSLIGKFHYEVFPEIPERWKVIHQRVLKGETLRHYADPFTRLDGSQDWVRWEVRPWHGPDDKIAGIIMFTQVVTQQILAERERENLLTSEREQRQLAETLTGISLALISKNSSSEILDEVLNQALKLVRYDAAYITLLDGDHLRLGRWHGQPGLDNPEMYATAFSEHSLEEMRFNKRAMDSLQPVLVSDTRAEPAWNRIAPMDWINCHLTMPVIARGRLYGLLSLSSAEPNQFTEDHVKRLHPLVNVAAIALENTSLFEQAQQEIKDRKRAQAALREMNNILEERVQERTVALAESEEKYRLLIEASNEGICLIQNGKYVFVNKAYETMFGWRQELLMTDDFEPAVLVAEKYHSQLPDDLLEIETGTQPYRRVDFTGVHSSGREFDVEGSISTLVYHGKPAFQAILHDATQRKAAERALRENEERFRSAFNHTPVGMALVQTDGRFFQVNQALQNMFNYSREELQTLRLEEVAVNFDRMKHFWNNLLKRDMNTYQIEAQYRSKGGETIWAITNMSAVTGQDDEIAYVICQFLDISQRKKIEQENQQLLAEFKHQNNLLHTAAEVSKSANTILEPARLIQQTVDLIRKRFDLYYVGLFLADETREQAVLHAGNGNGGQRYPINDLSLPIGGPSLIGRCIGSCEPQTVTNVQDETERFHHPALPETQSEIALPLMTRDGCIGALSVQYMTKEAFNESDVAVLQSMADQLAIAIENARLYEEAQHEIKGRLQAEAALYEINRDLNRHVQERTNDLAVAIKELEAFSYSVSHDLRAPLRSIQGFSQALLEDIGSKLDDIELDYLRRVKAAASRMEQLIGDLLNLSRLTQVEMARDPIDLSALAASIAQDLRQSEPERDVTFVIQPGMKTHGDQHLLVIMLQNLLNNAWKFTSEKDSAIIEFGTESKDDLITYYVKDNGAGFDMTYSDRLYMPFQRLHENDRFDGTGIGLATVKRIINRHGGRVWAESKIEQGATFYFTL